MRFKVELGGAVTVRHRGKVDLYHHYPDAPPYPQPSPPSPPTIITSTFEGFTSSARAVSMSYKLPQGKRIVVSITYLDEAGNPAVVETVNWSSSNEQAAPVQSDPNDFTRAAIDGLEIAQGIQINASADADLGSGTRELITLFDLDVVGGEAVTGQISVVGEPVDIPGNGGVQPPGGGTDPGSPTPDRPHIDHTLPGQPEAPYPQPQQPKRR